MHAARDTRGRCVVVLSIRADHYERCAAYPELSSLLAANHVLVTSMSHDELRQVVERPALRVGLRVDPELTDALVADVEGEPGALPLLSTALLELWRQRDGRHLRHAAYEHTGGVRGAVARLAEEAYGQLDEREQAIARGVLVRLATEGESGTVERRRVPLDELETERSEDVARVIERFTDQRLLTVDEEFVELAHEALLREWPRLREWIAEDSEGLRIHRGVRDGAQEWARLGHDDGALFRGTRLREAVNWREARNPALNASERAFLDASARRWERERTARRRWIRLAFAGLTVALAAITAVAAVALYQGREAGRQRDIAASRELAARANGLLDADPRLALALGLRALDRRDTEQAENVVRQATFAARGIGVRKAHDGWVYAAAPSSDGARVVTGGGDGIVRIWNTNSGRAATTIREPGAGRGNAIFGAAISPDGRLVADTGGDGVVAVHGRGRLQPPRAAGRRRRPLRQHHRLQPRLPPGGRPARQHDRRHPGERRTPDDAARPRRLRLCGALQQRRHARGERGAGPHREDLDGRRRDGDRAPASWRGGERDLQRRRPPGGDGRRGRDRARVGCAQRASRLELPRER